MIDKGPVIRLATLEDLDALVALENSVFSEDRLTPRSFRRLIERPTATCLVADAAGHVAGYALVLYRRGTALARLYSIAVDPAFQGQGVGFALLQAAESEAFDHECIFLRLEVRDDNQAALDLYRRHGYREFGRYLDYYTDHGTAIRLEKRLSATEPPTGEHPPYYSQTTDFTCGPACMIMAIAALDPGVKVDRRLEFKLWRESTTIFMTSGLGGCEPFGMSVALAERGYRAEIWTSSSDFFFIEGVRSKQRKDVMRVVQEEFRAQAKAAGVAVQRQVLNRERLSAALDDGGTAIVLVSGYQMFRDHTPHWILIHDYDDQHVYAHDPWVEDDALETSVAAAGLPIPWSAFKSMARVGRGRRTAAIVVKGARTR